MWIYSKLELIGANAMKLRGSSTDNLADVIQVLQLVRKTGLLQVQRCTVGNSVEQGTITLYDGQVVDATVNQLRGQDAFKKLMTWTVCYFVLEAAPPTTTFSDPLQPVAGVPVRVTTTEEQKYSKELSATYSVVPRRLLQINGALPDFNRLGLSRAHRQLFLLIDGKRSVYELIGLIRRHPQEVLGILSDLESTDLINL
jgi:hypothetical protein